MDRTRFNSVMRVLSVKGLKNKQESMKKNQPQIKLSVAPHEIGNSLESQSISLNLEDTDMNVE